MREIRTSGATREGARAQSRPPSTLLPLWFDRLLESISVNDPEVAMSRSRRRLTAPAAAL